MALLNLSSSASLREPRFGHHLRVSVVALGGVLLVLTTAWTTRLFAQDLRPDTCYKASLSQSIGWATSGAWVDDEQGKTLRVVDTSRDDVLRISPNGLVELSVPFGEVDSLAQRPAKPTELVARDGEYWLLEDDMPARFLRSNNGLESWVTRLDIEGRSIQKAGRYDRWQLMAVYHFTPMASGVLVFGDLQKDSDWLSAFLYFDEAGRWQVYRTLGTDETIRNYYIRDVSYLASLGETGYILRLDPKPVIVEVQQDSAKPQKLSSFPKDFQRWLRLDDHLAWVKIVELASTTRLLGPRKERIFYEIVEQELAAPAGLYAWRDYLYLLGRRKSETEGQAEWWLIKLDPRDGTELSRLPLPTSAAHLTVVPGDFWAFIEKQAVEAVEPLQGAYMRTDSMTLVPSTWIEEPSGRRLEEWKSTTCLSLSD